MGNGRAIWGDSRGWGIGEAPAAAEFQPWPGRILTLRTLAGLVGPCVYFIRTRDDLIKIGHTGNLADRHKHFGPGWEHILAVVPGTRADEKAMHDRFDAYLDHGREWFRPGPELIDHINEIREHLGVSAI